MVCRIDKTKTSILLGERLAFMLRFGAWRGVPSLALTLALCAAPASGQTAESRADARAALLRGLLGGADGVRVALPDAGSADYAAPLGLDEAVAMAMKSNFEILAAEKKKSGTEWDVVAAYGQYAPQVKFTYATGTERSSPASFNNSLGVRVDDDTHHRRDRVWEIQQPLVDLSILADILQRGLNDDVAEAERVGARERIALETVDSYLKLLQGVLTVGYAERYKAALDGLAERMQARVAGGGADRKSTRLNSSHT